MMLVWFAGHRRAGRAGDRRATPWSSRRSTPLYAVALLRAQRQGTASSCSARSCSCITGGEALYADMGHFGRRPIRARLVRRACCRRCCCNYFGQGALLIAERPSARVGNPFYALAPGWLLYPMVVLATVATVIASQALISGAFSLTQQAVQLGYWPRVTHRAHLGRRDGADLHPRDQLGADGRVHRRWCSASARRSNLAAAYGIAVTGTMTITSLLFYAVARQTLGLVAGRAPARCSRCSSPSICRSSSPTSAKIAIGRLVPARRGRGGVHRHDHVEARARRAGAADDGRARCRSICSWQDLAATKPHRVPGTAVFMTSATARHPAGAAAPLQAQQGAAPAGGAAVGDDRGSPVVAGATALEIEELGYGFYRVVAHYGFMQTPNVMKTLRRRATQGLKCDPDDDELLPRARDAPGDRQGAHGALAQGAVRVPVAELADGDGVLRPAAESRRRDGRADRAVTGAAYSCRSARIGSSRAARRAG